MYICVQKYPVMHLRFQRKYVYLIVFFKYFILVLFLFLLSFGRKLQVHNGILQSLLLSAAFNMF